MTAVQPIAGAPGSRVIPAPEHNLDVLLGCAATGDEAAFMRVYDLTANCVYGLALRLLKEPADAQDVALAAYREIWSRSTCFDSARHYSAATWIIATAHLYIVTLVRARAKQEQLHMSDVTHVRRVPGRPALAVVRPRTAAALTIAPALARRPTRDTRVVVPDAQRGALVLACLNGHTLTEEAALTMAPTETAAFRLPVGLARPRLIAGAR